MIGILQETFFWFGREGRGRWGGRGTADSQGGIRNPQKESICGDEGKLISRTNYPPSNVEVGRL